MNSKQTESESTQIQPEESIHGFKQAVTRQVTQRSFLQTVSAVLCAFFGVRKAKNHEEDIQNLNPIHVIIIGVLAAFCFVVTLLVIVHAVVPTN